MIWNLSDSTFLSSTHALAGLAYSRNGWLFSAEEYLKQNRNEMYFIDNEIIVSDNNLLGTDIYFKKEGRHYTVFGSYSIVNASMPQKSTGQEIKSGAIASFKSFHFSAMYVYGTGFVDANGDGICDICKKSTCTAGTRPQDGTGNQNRNGNRNGKNH